jgi:hypothetical protein
MAGWAEGAVEELATGGEYDAELTELTAFMVTPFIGLIGTFSSSFGEILSC